MIHLECAPGVGGVLSCGRASYSSLNCGTYKALTNRRFGSVNSVLPIVPLVLHICLYRKWEIISSKHGSVAGHFVS